MKIENIISINGTTIKKIKWKPKLYPILSEIKNQKTRDKNFFVDLPSLL